MHAVEGIAPSERTSGSGSAVVMAVGVEMPLRGGGDAEFGTSGNDTRCS